MKKYTLEAEFKVSNSHDGIKSQKDFISQVGEFASLKEAKTHLDCLIVKRMSSKPGWHYELLNSNVVEIKKGKG